MPRRRHTASRDDSDHEFDDEEDDMTLEGSSLGGGDDDGDMVEEEDDDDGGSDGDAWSDAGSAGTRVSLDDGLLDAEEREEEEGEGEGEGEGEEPDDASATEEGGEEDEAVHDEAHGSEEDDRAQDSHRSSRDEAARGRDAGKSARRVAARTSGRGRKHSGGKQDEDENAMPLPLAAWCTDPRPLAELLPTPNMDVHIGQPLPRPPEAALRARHAPRVACVPSQKRQRVLRASGHPILPRVAATEEAPPSAALEQALRALGPGGRPQSSGVDTGDSNVEGGGAAAVPPVWREGVTQLLQEGMATLDRGVMLEVLRSHARTDSLGQQLVDHYDHFMQVMLPTILRDQGFARIAVLDMMEEHELAIVGDVVYTPPQVMEADGTVRRVTPEECQRRGLTYGVTVLVNVRHRTFRLEPPAEAVAAAAAAGVTVQRHMGNRALLAQSARVPAGPDVLYREYPLIQEFPIPIGSRFGPPVEPRRVPGSWFRPVLGCFVYCGYLKHLLAQKNQRTNQPLIKRPPGNTRFTAMLEVRSDRPDIRARSTSNISLRVAVSMVGKRYRCDALRITMPYVGITLHQKNEGVPLYALLRILGAASPEEVVALTWPDPSEAPPGAAAFVREGCEARYTDASVDDILSELAKLTKEAQPRQFLLQVMGEVLPPEDARFTAAGNTRKLVYLTRVCLRRLVHHVFGVRPPDNRSFEGNKLIEMNGKIIGHMVRQLVKKYFEGFTTVFRATGRYGNHPNLEVEFTASKLTGMLHGHWANGQVVVHRAASKGGGGAVITQLIAVSDLTLRSYMERINIPMSRSGKSDKGRSVRMDQFGLICMAESPEGDNIGLVETFALYAHVRIGTPTALLMDLAHRLRWRDDPDYDPALYIARALGQVQPALPAHEAAAALRQVTAAAAAKAGCSHEAAAAHLRERMPQPDEPLILPLPALEAAAASPHVHAASEGPHWQHNAAGATAATDHAARLGMPGQEDVAALAGRLRQGVLVLVNGAIAGYTRDRFALARAAREARRDGRLPRYTSVYQWEDAVCINDEPDVLTLPLFVVARLHRAAPALAAARLQGQEPWEALCDAGVIEYVDAWEKQELLLAESFEAALTRQEDLATGAATRCVTHVQITPAMHLGTCASLVPAAGHNPGTRLMYFSAMAKQLLAAMDAEPLALAKHGYGYLNVYPQAPLVQTVPAQVGQHYDFPAGCMAVVAVDPDPLGQEDALVFNKASIERGMGRILYIRSHKQREGGSGSSGGGGSGRAIICHPRLPLYDAGAPQEIRVIKMQANNYSTLAPDGVVPRGVHVRNGDALVGQTLLCSRVGPDGKPQLARRDASLILRCPEHAVGTVINVAVMAARDDARVVQVDVAFTRSVQLGDKWSTRHGQKGTVGSVVPQEDMPLVHSTDRRMALYADVKFHPTSYPSRESVGQLWESSLSLLSAGAGKCIDLTAFRRFDAEALLQTAKEELRCADAVEVIDGRTGKVRKRPMTVGLVHYSRLKHMVDDKAHGRARGKRNDLTWQPMEGRHMNGGMRVGEMERDAFVAHGAAKVLEGRLYTGSDARYLYFCRRCGNRAEDVPLTMDEIAEGKGHLPPALCRRCKEEPRNAARVMSTQSYKVALDMFRLVGVEARHVLSGSAK